MMTWGAPTEPTGTRAILRVSPSPEATSPGQAVSATGPMPPCNTGEA